MNLKIQTLMRTCRVRLGRLRRRTTVYIFGHIKPILKDFANCRKTLHSKSLQNDEKLNETVSGLVPTAMLPFEHLNI